jgi:hypothetical protein
MRASPREALVRGLSGNFQKNSSRRSIFEAIIPLCGALGTRATTLLSSSHCQSDASLDQGPREAARNSHG